MVSFHVLQLVLMGFMPVMGADPVPQCLPFGLQVVVFGLLPGGQRLVFGAECFVRQILPRSAVDAAVEVVPAGDARPCESARGNGLSPFRAVRPCTALAFGEPDRVAVGVGGFGGFEDPFHRRARHVVVVRRMGFDGRVVQHAGRGVEIPVVRVSAAVHETGFDPIAGVAAGRFGVDVCHDGSFRFLDAGFQTRARLMLMSAWSMSGSPSSGHSISALRMMAFTAVLCAVTSSHCQHWLLHMP